MTRVLAIGKIRYCGKCKRSKIFYKERTGHYHCETCGEYLVERAKVQS